MKSIEKVGKTIQEAIDEALSELGCGSDEADVEILEEPSKGFLGFGSKPARVRVTRKWNPVVCVRSYLEDVFQAMGVNVDMDVRQEKEQIHVSFSGKSLGILIGRRGETLDSLQYLANLVVNRKADKRYRVFLDVENYRQKREDTLVKLAKRLSEKVRRTGQRVVLNPMSPQERRIIHTALQEERGIVTFSEGDEPFRKVVIAVKKG